MGSNSASEEAALRRLVTLCGNKRRVFSYVSSQGLIEIESLEETKLV